MATASTKSANSTSTARRPRADALRNRERLIDAAAACFAEHGLEIGVAAIARRADVGSATLFRNFATKDDLIYAVIEARVNELLTLAKRALEVDDPGASFEQFLFDAADFQARDIGFFEAIHSRIIDEPELMDCKTGMTAIAEKILKRAQKAGVIRNDVNADDLRFILMSAVRNTETSSDPLIHRRYLRIMLDGLRPDHASSLSTGRKKQSEQPSD